MQRNYRVGGQLADGAGDDLDVIEIELRQELADKFGLAEEQDIDVELNEDGSLELTLKINLAPRFVDERKLQVELAAVLEPYMHEYAEGWR